MLERARQKMIDKVHEFTGRADCGEVVLLQKRASWALPVIAVAVAVIIGLLTLVDINGGIIRGALIGGAVGLGITVVSTNFWIAYCDGTVLLIKVGKFQANPEAVVAEHAYPVESSIDGGMLTKRVTFAGERYIMARQFEDRFRSITG